MLLKGDDLVSIEEDYFKVNEKILQLVYLPDTVYNSVKLHLDLKFWSLGPIQIKITIREDKGWGNKMAKTEIKIDEHKSRSDHCAVIVAVKERINIPKISIQVDRK